MSYQMRKITFPKFDSSYPQSFDNEIPNKNVKRRNQHKIDENVEDIIANYKKERAQQRKKDKSMLIPKLNVNTIEKLRFTNFRNNILTKKILTGPKDINAISEDDYNNIGEDKKNLLKILQSVDDVQEMDTELIQSYSPVKSPTQHTQKIFNRTIEKELEQECQSSLSKMSQYSPQMRLFKRDDNKTIFRTLQPVHSTSTNRFKENYLALPKIDTEFKQVIEKEQQLKSKMINLNKSIQRINNAYISDYQQFWKNRAHHKKFEDFVGYEDQEEKFKTISQNINEITNLHIYKKEQEDEGKLGLTTRSRVFAQFNAHVNFCQKHSFL